MLRRTILHLPIAILAAAISLNAQAPAAPAGQAAPAPQAGRGPASPPMVLTTPAFPDGGVIPNRHTQVQQAERGISPQLVWTNAPAATQSFVVHMRDPEVARNRTTDDQVHWLVWNIPATEKGLPEGMPEGAQLPNGIRQISASGAGISRPRRACRRPYASLHVRGVCARYQDRHAPRRRCVGNPAEFVQGDGRPRHRESRHGRHVQATAIGRHAFGGSRCGRHMEIT